MSRPTPSRAFSIIEVLVSLAIVAVLMAILVPSLARARLAGYAAVSQANLKQIAAAWSAYLVDHEQFPAQGDAPEWFYGGVEFGPDADPVLDRRRPINAYLGDDGSARRLAEVFRSPVDTGFTDAASVGGRSFFNWYGTSYLANRELVDPTRPGFHSFTRVALPLRLAEIQVSASRLILVGEPEWHYASPPFPVGDARASWWRQPGQANVATLDGAARFAVFPDALGAGLTRYPFTRVR